MLSRIASASSSSSDAPLASTKAAISFAVKRRMASMLGEGAMALPGGVRCPCYSSPMRERRSAAREKTGRSRYWLLGAALLGAGIVLIPILYTGGAMDAFRLPKEMAFRFEAIALALTGVFAATA